MERIKNFPTENQEQRKPDDSRGQSEWNNLRLEFGTFVDRALLRVAEDVKTDKRRDDQRLPFGQTTDSEQKKSEIPIAALQKEKTRDQKWRDEDVEVTERHAVEYERELERSGDN